MDEKDRECSIMNCIISIMRLLKSIHECTVGKIEALNNYDEYNDISTIDAIVFQ